MKKILLATSALVALGGAAYADVSVSGSGYMGVTYDDSVDPSDDEMRFKSRIRIQFDASGETDNGLTFGASVIWTKLTAPARLLLVTPLAPLARLATTLTTAAQPSLSPALSAP
jgi:hypothetical protein